MMDVQIVERFREFQQTEEGKEYRDLGIDRVVWEAKKLDSINYLFRKGKTPKYADGETSITVIKSGQARGYYNQFDFTKRQYLKEEVFNSTDERNLIKGDILINTTGKGTAGRVTLFNLEGNFVADSHIAIFRLDKKLYLPTYILNCFVRYGFAYLESLASGSGGQIELSLDVIRSLKIPIPKKLNEKYTSLEIQKALVSFIDYYQQENDRRLKVLEKVEEDITNLEKLIIPLFFQKHPSVGKRFDKFCLENKLTLQLQDIDFGEKSILDIADKIKAGATPSRKEPKYWGKKEHVDSQNYYPWIDINRNQFKKLRIESFKESITVEGLQASSTWLVPPYSVMITIAGSLGYVAYNTFETATNQNILNIQLKEGYFYKYIVFALENFYSYKVRNQTNNYSNLSKGSESKRVIQIPKSSKNVSSFDIQKIIADFFDDFFERLSEMKSTITILKQLYKDHTQTLIHKTFNAANDTSREAAGIPAD